MVKKPTHVPDVVIEDGEGDAHDRAIELIEQLKRESNEGHGGFILIFDSVEREAVGMVSNLEHNATIKVLEMMLETSRKAVN